ncbi:MAG TPA: diacylglycerol kinase family protein [Patescibacteria group bacterium]|nr:diacylglycerol kinase family protein [Patescibacteria group bacterium]
MVEAGGNKLLIVAKKDLSRKEERKLGRIVNRLARRRFEVDVKRTPSVEAAQEAIKDSIGNVHGLGIFGGDGALRTAVEALVDNPTPSDQLPLLFAVRGAGSIKLFQKATGNYLSERGVARTLEEGKSYEMDIIRARIDGGTANGGRDLYFLSNASLGKLIGGLFNQKDRTKSKRGGFWGYLPLVPKVVNDAKEFTAEVTTNENQTKKTFKTPEIFVLNGGKGGFIAFDPDQAYDGKELLSIVFNDVPVLKSKFTIAASVLSGLIFDATHPGKQSEFEQRFRAEKIRIDLPEGDPIYLQLDGDGVGVVNSSIEFSIAEKPIRVMLRDQSRPGIRRRLQEIFHLQGRPFRQEGEKVVWTSSKRSN